MKTTVERVKIAELKALLDDREKMIHDLHVLLERAERCDSEFPDGFLDVFALTICRVSAESVLVTG